MQRVDEDQTGGQNCEATDVSGASGDRANESERSVSTLSLSGRTGDVTFSSERLSTISRGDSLLQRAAAKSLSKSAEDTLNRASETPPVTLVEKAKKRKAVTAVLPSQDADIAKQVSAQLEAQRKKLKPSRSATDSGREKGGQVTRMVIKTKKRTRTALERELRPPLLETAAGHGRQAAVRQRNSGSARHTAEPTGDAGAGTEHTVAATNNRFLQQSGDIAASQVRLTTLWSAQGPLRHSRYFWPNCNAEEFDQSLVKLDWIIDYIGNMTLVAQAPTTSERMRLVADYTQNPEENRQRFLELEQFADENDIQMSDIDRDTVPCTDDPYVWNPAVFAKQRNADTKVRPELGTLTLSIEAICNRALQRRQADGGEESSSGSVAIDGGLAATGGGERETHLHLLSHIYRRMHMTQYEQDHPHGMSPMHQRLFIGLLNRLPFKHTKEQLDTLDANVVAQSVFGVAAGNPAGWSIKLITAMGRQMAAYLAALGLRIKRKKAEMVYIYGEEKAAVLANFYHRRLKNLHWQVQRMHDLLLVQAAMFQRGNKPNIPERPSLLYTSVLAPSLNCEAVYESMSDYQRTVRRLLDECQKNGYRRCKGAIYREVIVDGYRTNAFKKHADIEQYVWNMPDMNLNLGQWLEQTSRGNLTRDTITYLQNCHQPEFLPDLKRQQWVWSFRNGIYDGEQDVFWRYDSEEIRTNTDSPYYRAESSARFIDKEFNDAHLMSAATRANPRLIKVDAMDRIVRAQQLGKDVVDWMWASWGRLYFPGRMRDNWQVVFWLKGVAGAGKSTLTHAIKAPYDAADIGIMQNNVETQFGLEPLYDNFLILAPEVKANFSLDSAVFQVIASNDETSVSRKGRAAVALEAWSTPCLFVSNVFPTWVDSSGSIQRRILCVLFDCVIPESEKDTSLEQQLLDNVDAIVVRACRSYNAMLKLVGTDDVWKHVPHEFKVAREQVRRDTSQMAMFLESVLVLSDQDTDFVTVEDLRVLYTSYAQKNETGGGGGYGRGGGQSDSFDAQLARDIPSFHDLRVSVLDEASRVTVVRGCRLHLPKACSIMTNDHYLPQENSGCPSCYFTLEQMTERDLANKAREKLRLDAENAEETPAVVDDSDMQSTFEPIEPTASGGALACDDQADAQQTEIGDDE